MSGPRVSVGLPVYNGERFLAAAIESVLAQTYRDFELIICDNASTDATEAIALYYAVRESRISYFRSETNLGAPRNFNRAFELSRGEYFKWLAADDLIAPTYLESCVEALDATPEAVVAYTRGGGIDGEGGPLGAAQHPVDLALQADPVERFRLFRQRSGFNAWPLFYVFGLMRSEALERTRLHGAYINSDNCLVYELLFRGCFVEAPEALSYFRLHEGSSSWYAKEPKARQQFFDPNGGRVSTFMGERRLYWEYLVAIGRAPLRLEQKAALLLYNLRWALNRDAANEAESSLVAKGA